MAAHAAGDLVSLDAPLSDDESLSDEQIQALLQGAEDRLRQNSSLQPKRPRPGESMTLPTVNLNTTIQPCIDFTKGAAARVNPLYVPKQKDQDLAGRIRAIESESTRKQRLKQVCSTVKCLFPCCLPPLPLPPSTNSAQQAGADNQPAGKGSHSWPRLVPPPANQPHARSEARPPAPAAQVRAGSQAPLQEAAGRRCTRGRAAALLAGRDARRGARRVLQRAAAQQAARQDHGRRGLGRRGCESPLPECVRRRAGGQDEREEGGLQGSQSEEVG